MQLTSINLKSLVMVFVLLFAAMFAVVITQIDLVVPSTSFITASANAANANSSEFNLSSELSGFDTLSVEALSVQDIALLSTGLAGVEYDISHAIKHGEELMLMTRQCLNKNGPTVTWVNPDTKHFGMLCWVEELGTWAVQIVAKIEGRFKELTIFKQDGVAEAEWYMNSRGYGVIN